MANKLVVMVTKGPDEAELATVAFGMAVNGQMKEMDVVVGFQADAVLLAKSDTLPSLQAPNLPALKDLVARYLEAGGIIRLCGPCVNSRSLTEGDFIEGCTIIDAGAFIDEIVDATNVLVY